MYGCGRGPVLGVIRPGSKLLVIAEAPGNSEVDHGEPLVGMSGQFMDKHLMAGGTPREQTSLTNTLLCQPPPTTPLEDYLQQLQIQAQREGKDYVSPIACCAPRLERDIREADATVEYAMGKAALQALSRHYGIPYGGAVKVDSGQLRFAEMRKQHGSPLVIRPGGPDAAEPRKVVIASYHPAFGFRGAKAWLPVIGKVIERAARLAASDGQLEWFEPVYNIDPTIEQIEAWAERAVAGQHRVMVDIETGPSDPDANDGAYTQTCKLRTVGWGLWVTDASGAERYDIMQVPIHDMEGNPVWQPADMLRVFAAIRRVMDECPLAFHNGAFDTAVLLRLGLMSSRTKQWWDTIIAHHDTDSNDLPHDLGFVIAEHFDAPRHKDDADHKSVSNVDYPRLKLYGAKDVYSQMRCAEALTERVQQCNTWAQFATDTALVPVARDMGDLGLVIIEPQRQQLAVELTAKIQESVLLLRFEMGLALAEKREEPSGAIAAKQRENILDSDLEPAAKREMLAKLYRESAERWELQGVNPRSVPQLREFFFVQMGLLPQLNTEGYDFDAEDGDDPSTSSSALLKLSDKYPNIGAVADALLEFRSYDKLYGTYVADRRGLIHPVDWSKWGLPSRPDLWILNAMFRVHIVPTGRLSSSPNVQNWPSIGKANMHTMVGAPPGHCMVGADFDQIELRLYAAAAQDKLLLEAFAKGLDPHSLNAASLWAEHEDEIWDWYNRINNAPSKERKYFRLVAKRFGFLEIYGGKPEKLFATMFSQRDKVTGKRDFPKLTMKEVLVWHDRWHRLHPETKVWQRACQVAVHEQGYVAVPVLDRRKRFFPGGIDQENAPPNLLIQGHASSISNRALLRIAEAIPYRGWSGASGPCLQIHDFLAAYVPRHRAIEAQHIIREAMCTTYRDVPITASPQQSFRLSDQA